VVVTVGRVGRLWQPNSVPAALSVVLALIDKTKRIVDTCKEDCGYVVMMVVG